MPVSASCRRGVLCLPLVVSLFLGACHLVPIEDLKPERDGATSSAVQSKKDVADTPKKPAPHHPEKNVRANGNSPCKNAKVPAEGPVCRQHGAHHKTDRAKKTLGEVESAQFVNLDNLTLAARIDTGAKTSSIRADVIREFDRDGGRWVRFSIERDGHKPLTLERPVLRRVRIKRQEADHERRHIISLKVRIGPILQTTEFSLARRDEFEYPVLIGRNFLQDVAVVDVSYRYHITAESPSD